MKGLGFRFALLGIVFGGWGVVAQAQSNNEDLTYPVGLCDEVIPRNQSVYSIIGEVFFGKIESLISSEMLSEDFQTAITGADFIVCNNRSYETFVYYSEPPIIVFEPQLVGYLFLQSRALTLGQYVSDETGGDEPFELHRQLVKEFSRQGDSLNGDVFRVIFDEAQRLGVTASFIENSLADPLFKKREQTFFLQAMYFLVMHEVCHIALGHSSIEQPRKELDETELRTLNIQRELDADSCAIDVINRDEAQYKSAPVSFFGAFMTVSTQLIINNILKNEESQRHPSTSERLVQLKDETLQFIDVQRPENAEHYIRAIEATESYFSELSTEF